MPKFDAKSFNEKAFGKYMTAVPNTRLNKLRASRAITGDARLRETFKDNSQTGTVYAILPYFGLLGGEAQNYDGQTDVKTDRTKTFEQGVFTYGRMHGWTEADFSYDVTGGVDFMANVRAQLMECYGYETQIMEFIDMAHTPKNLLLRGVKKKGMQKHPSVEKVKELLDALSCHQTLYDLLMGEEVQR